MKQLTYLINLDSSTTRLNNIKKELEQQNLAYERISAIDGRKLSPSQYPSTYDAKTAQYLMGKELIGGQIGCYLSHVHCLEKFLASDADYLLVLEDDIHFLATLPNIIKNSLTYLFQTNQNWYVIHLSDQKNFLKKPITKIDSHTINRSYYFPTLTPGLLWSRIGAKTFLIENPKIQAPIDVALQMWLCRNGMGLSFTPPPVTSQYQR